MQGHLSFRFSALVGISLLGIVMFLGVVVPGVRSQSTNKDPATDNAVQLVTQGRQIFRFDTFGDQTFWGDTLKLRQAIWTERSRS